jgi:tripartite-type tricarboxylate transporter receptor subunit TctC
LLEFTQVLRAQSKTKARFLCTSLLLMASVSEISREGQHGTPDAVIRTLEAAFLEVARDPAVQAEMKTQGFVPLAMGRHESRANIEKMTAVFKDLAQLVKE